MSNDNSMIPVCNLWKKVSQHGRPYLMGRMAGVRVLVFENQNRQGDNDPTHNLVFTAAPTENRQGQGGQQGGGSTGGGRSNYTSPPQGHQSQGGYSPGGHAESDDIPF